MTIDIGMLSADVNLPLIVAIIGILLAVRKADTHNRLHHGFYVIAVLGLGFVMGLFVAQGSIREIVINGIVHAGIASIVYQTGKLAIPSKGLFFNKGGPADGDR